MVFRKPVLSIREQIEEHIRTDILAGELAEGEPLREQDLADRFGVSRGPIRDVLLKLTQEGLLVSEPNRGVKVGAALDAWIQPLLVDLRLQIEVFALAKVIEEITDENIEYLSILVDRLRDACKKQDVASIAKNDMAFHRMILDLAGDDNLTAIWLPIVARMMLHYSRHRDMMEAHVEHAAILQAIQAGDKEGAEKALIQNIQ